MRNYSKEHQDRMKSRKRLIAEIEREKAQTFQALLRDHDTTFSYWINERINEYIKDRAL
jgi:hypothetical protein